MNTAISMEAVPWCRRLTSGRQVAKSMCYEQRRRTVEHALPISIHELDIVKPPLKTYRVHTIDLYIAIPKSDLVLQTHLMGNNKVSDGELENGNSLDGEGQTFDSPSSCTWPLKLHTERVCDARVGRHLPVLLAAAQRLRRVDQTGNDVIDTRLHDDGKVAGMSASVADVHWTNTMVLCSHTEHLHKRSTVI